MKFFTKYVPFVGFFLWIVFAYFKSPKPMLQSWAELLLIFAVLVLTPIAIGIFSSFFNGKNEWLSIAEQWALPAGILCALSFLLDQGGFATILVVPWVMISLILALSGLNLLRTQGKKISFVAASTGALFFPVGTAWALMDRAGMQPFGYDAAIVLLTAVHFHFAGFFFPLIMAALAKAMPSKFIHSAIWLFVIGVPLTAVGISLGHFYQNYLVEAISGSIVVVAVLLTALSQLAFLLKKKMPIDKKLTLGISSSLFIFAMLLAACYANRVWLLWEWFSIPNLRFWHGTANTIAVTLSLLGWWKIKGFQ